MLVKYWMNSSKVVVGVDGPMKAISILIAPLSDIPMFYIKYLTMHKVHMHADAIRQLLYGCAYVREIIHSLKLVDYLPVYTHKPYNNLQIYNSHIKKTLSTFSWLLFCYFSFAPNSFMHYVVKDVVGVDRQMKALSMHISKPN